MTRLMAAIATILRREARILIRGHWGIVVAVACTRNEDGIMSGCRDIVQANDRDVSHTVVPRTGKRDRL